MFLYYPCVLTFNLFITAKSALFLLLCATKGNILMIFNVSFARSRPYSFGLGKRSIDEDAEDNFTNQINQATQPEVYEYDEMPGTYTHICYLFIYACRSSYLMSLT